MNVHEASMKKLPVYLNIHESRPAATSHRDQSPEGRWVNGQVVRANGGFAC